MLDGAARLSVDGARDQGLASKRTGLVGQSARPHGRRWGVGNSRSLPPRHPTTSELTATERESEQARAQGPEWSGPCRAAYAHGPVRATIQQGPATRACSEHACAWLHVHDVARHLRLNVKDLWADGCLEKVAQLEVAVLCEGGQRWAIVEQVSEGGCAPETAEVALVGGWFRRCLPDAPMPPCF